MIRIFRRFDLGFSTATVDFMGELAGSDDREGRKGILATALVIFSALGIAWGSAQVQPGDDFPRIIVAGAAALTTFLAFAALPLDADERAFAAAKILRMLRDSAAQN